MDEAIFSVCEGSMKQTPANDARSNAAPINAALTNWG
jgi:hypothetical protein